MSRIPIRIRLTLVFALALVAVLAGAAWFVRSELDTSFRENVLEALEAHAAAPSSVTGDPEEQFAQLLTREGRIVERRGNLLTPALTPAEVGRIVGGGRIIVDRVLPGIEGTARVLAIEPDPPVDGVAAVVVGESLSDRDETLDSLTAAFIVAGPIALVLASLVGYALAAAALRPVEAMRRRAAEISPREGDGALPLPAARDELRRLGETLNAMLARLRTAFARERRFVADASHELRTPIAIVKTELEGVLRAGELPPGARDGLRAALAETDLLGTLVEDLLLLARAGDGALPVRPERLDAREALDAAAGRFADRARGEGRPVDVRAPEDLALRADPLRLRQALGNLVDNALRHGAGTITLTAEAAADGTAVTVGDDGPGFDPELRERAFERFSRGDEARTRGGAGLGLAIVRAIAEAHGGRATIAPGAPSTVRLVFPPEP